VLESLLNNEFPHVGVGQCAISILVRLRPISYVIQACETFYHAINQAALTACEIRFVC
jgi:hypothetical protein